MSDDPNLIDRPLTSPQDDLLERDAFVEGLVRTLITDRQDADGNIVGRKSTGYVVGLTGQWGSGKSTILHFVEAELLKLEHVTVALFNPWIFKGRDELLAGFFVALRDALGKSRKENVRDLRATLHQYWSAITFIGKGGAAVVDLMGGSGAASAIITTGVESLDPGLPPPLSPLQERRSLESKLRKADQAVVVLIDELDRVEDDEVRAVAQLIKAVGDIDGISYLVAYDDQRVVEALGRGDTKEERHTSGAHYLEKIIQYPVPVRPIFHADAKALLEAALSANSNSDFDWDELVEDKIFRWILFDIETPRDVKRLVGSYSIIHEAVRGEINRLDVLAYCWILVKCPLLRKAISENIDKVVDDPSLEEMYARGLEGMSGGHRAPSVEKVLGSSAKKYSRLLGLLFPRFSGARGAEEFYGDRISARQNLIRLLYLGNPPDMVPRRVIEQLWRQEEPDAILDAFQVHSTKSTIRPLINRVEDLVESLPPEGDSRFWCSLSKFLVRDSDWLSEPDASKAVATDAGDVLVRMGLRNDALRERVRAVYFELIKQGDLILAPHLLRKFLVHFGLSKYSTRIRDDDHIVSREEAVDLLSSEIERYKQAILSGFVLKRIPTMSAIFAVSNAKCWDEKMRSAFTRQLKRPEALSTFAAQTVPPGFTIDREALDELMNADEIHEYVNSLGPPTNWVPNELIALSVRRLTKVFEGVNIMFMEEEDD